MWKFAWRNLLTRPLRTALGLVGLSVPILGFIGLFSLANGLRDLVGDTLNQIQGVMVQRGGVPSPVFSDLPTSTVADLEKIPGVRAAAPEVWKIVPDIDGESPWNIRNILGSVFLKGGAPKAKGGAGAARPPRSILDTIVVCGQDIPSHKLLSSPVYPRALLPPEKGGGRFLNEGDIGSYNVVISEKIAREYPRSDGKPRQVGDTIQMEGKDYTIVGLYNTNSMFLDVAILMDINSARRLFKLSEQQISCAFVEGDDPSRHDELTGKIEEAIPGVDARGMSEYLGLFTQLLGNFDHYLLGIVGLALLVGVVGIVNTMLMSITERFAEFGVLRTNGWSQGHVLALVTAESAYLGVISGLIGCVLAVVGAMVANQFLQGGLSMAISPSLLGWGMLISVTVAILGGLYPAARAARMTPMDAIRLGSH
jgi:putative ABC transport system permease protein